MKRGDMIVLFACLALAGLLFLPRLFMPPASELVATSGEGRREFPLREDRIEEVGGVVIEIKDGRARVAGSPCRDQLCVKAGWLSKSGESAVCLPQRVVIRIGGQSGVDGIAY